MSTEKHDPWALLREARKFVVDAERLWIEWDNEQEERAVVSMLARIDDALAAPPDSATPVVDSVVWRNTPDGEDAVVNNAVLSVWGWRGGWAWQRKPLAEPSYLNRTESGLSNTLDEAKSAAIAAARGLK